MAFCVPYYPLISIYILVVSLFLSIIPFLSLTLCMSVCVHYTCYIHNSIQPFPTPPHPPHCPQVLPLSSCTVNSHESCDNPELSYRAIKIVLKEEEEAETYVLLAGSITEKAQWLGDFAQVRDSPCGKCS